MPSSEEDAAFTPLPEDVRSHFAWTAAPACVAVIAALEAAAPGGARFVGGCVRDGLLGRPIGDIDIATTLTPDAVLAALAAAGLKAVPTGLDHGTVTAVADGEGFEITTLRADVATDGRHAEVRFSTDWDTDWRRRDFTMNAVYLTPDLKLYDPAGGRVDALAGRVRFIGAPSARIEEDYLRILRFYRFSAWYGHGIDGEGDAACGAGRLGMRTLSSERIRVEVLKLLAAPDPVPALRAMEVNGVFDEIWPWPHEIAALGRLIAGSPEAAPILRLAALLPDAPEYIAQRLRLSNREADRRRGALKAAAALAGAPSDKTLRAVAYRMGREAASDGVRLAAARGGEADWRRLAATLDGWTAPAFPLKGADAAALGVPAGPDMGGLLKAAEDWWVAEDFPPEEALRKKLKAFAEDGAYD